MVDLTKASFVFGADASDNGKFIALVMGDRTDVLKLHAEVCKQNNLKRIHMRRIIEKHKVIKSIEERCTSAVHLYCLKVDKQRHNDTLSASLKTKYMPSIQRKQNIDYCTIMEIKNVISDSLNMFYQNWWDITVEADGDTMKLFKVIGANVITDLSASNEAYQLADAVAWANHADYHISKVREADISSEIESRLRKKLKL